MTHPKEIEWLALQRLYYLKPKEALEGLSSAPASAKGFLLRSSSFGGQVGGQASTQSLNQAKKDLSRIQKLGLEIISFDSDSYPKILKQIYDPPLVLLAKGNWPRWEEKPWVAVVGARKATEFGRKKVRELVKDLVEKELGIVSGLAYGIDSEAHQASVKAGGITWGVLGSGPDRLYPQRNLSLAEEMIETGGGYLSEFPLGTPPYAKHFPQRNRIISGLSHAVIIVEAGIKSGSLITGRFGLEQGREVFVVEPPEDNVAYEGNKWLLEQGATPFESAGQVWEVIKPQWENAEMSLRGAPKVRRSNHPVSKGLLRRPTKGVTPRNDNLIVSLLKRPQSLEYLTQKTNRRSTELLVELTQLESQGFIKKLPGALWQSL